MPARRVRLCPVDVPSFKHPLQARDAVLFVELRTLRQIGNAIEILDLEEVVPPSVPPATIFEDTISVKCSEVRYSRKYRRIAA
jgi:hypothetical protein